MQQFLIVILALGLILLQVLMGGFKLFFSIPGYCVIGVCGVLVLAVSNRRMRPTPRLIPVLSAILLAAYVMARTWTSPVEYLARSDRYMVLAALLVYLIMAFCITLPRHRLLLCWILFAFAGVQIIVGFIQFYRVDQFMLLSLLPDGFPIPQIFRPDYDWRASGFYGCPNYLAGLLEALLMLAMSLAVLGRWRPFPRIVIAYCALMFLAGVAVTGSRGGYLSTVAGLLVFLVLILWVMKKLRPAKFFLTLSFSLICAGVAIGVAFYVMSENTLIQGRLSKLIETKNMRRHMWAAAVQQSKLSPMFGTGSGTYLYYGRQFRHPTVQNDPVHVHCDYLELLSEYGLVGAGFGALFLAAHAASGAGGIARIVRRRLRPANRIFSDELAMILGSAAALGTLISHSVVDFNGHIPANTVFYAFLFGILANPSSDPEIAGADRPWMAWSARVGIPCLGAFLLVLVLPRLRGEYHAEWARVHLRSSEYIDLTSSIHRRLSWSLASLPGGIPGPITLEDPEHNWAVRYKREHLMSGVISHAGRGIQSEGHNPSLFYFLGEAKHFLAMTDSNPNRRREQLKEAIEAYTKGIEVYPNEFPILIKLGRALDNLALSESGDVAQHAFNAAEVSLAKAMRIDPNQALPYAYFGYHLGVQGKYQRAEAYYMKALTYPGEQPIAVLGLQAVREARARVSHPDSEDTFTLPEDPEPLTPEDEARGVSIHE